VALDTPEGLRRRLFRRRVIVRLASVNEKILKAVSGLKFVRGLEHAADQLIVELADPERERPELVRRIGEAGGQVLEVSEERRSLEEVYLSLVREGEDE